VGYAKIATISTDTHHASQEFRASTGAQWPFLSDQPGLREAWDADDYSLFHGWERRSPQSTPSSYNS
jgi:peroxiredoxin